MFPLFPLKSYLILLFCTFLSYSSFAQDHSFNWAAAVYCDDLSLPKTIAVDKSGFIYCLGFFEGTADLDPGVGTYSVTASTLRDGFLIKLDPDGNLIWARILPNIDSYSTNGRLMVLDKYGNPHISIAFKGIMSLTTVNGPVQHTANGGKDIIVLKYSPNGNLLWSRQLSSSGNSLLGEGVAVDDGANVYAVGQFKNDLNTNLMGTAQMLHSNNSYRPYLVKFDANGQHVWSKTWGGSASNAQGWANNVVINSKSEVLVTTTFTGTFDFDPTFGSTINSAGGYDAAISKFNAQGDFQWVKRIGSGGEEKITRLIVDDNDNILGTGRFEGTVDFDPGSGVHHLTSPAHWDIYVFKLADDGSFKWAKAMTGGTSNYGISVAVDSRNNVYTTGTFGHTVDFDPGPQYYPLSYPSGRTFLSKLDSMGNFEYAKLLGGNWGREVVLDAADNVYTTSIFKWSRDFDPDSSVFMLQSQGLSYNLSITKLGHSCLVDASVNNYAPILTSNANEVQYQWMECKGVFLPISGATSQSYHPPGNGFYAVEVSNGACKDTSDCMKITNVGIESANTAQQLCQLSPNPSSGSCWLNMGNIQVPAVELHLLDAQGRLLKSWQVRDTTTPIPVEWEGPAGLYFLQVLPEGQAPQTLKWMKL